MSAEAPAVKKAPKAKKAPAVHPPFNEMIKNAIKELKERNGSSRQAITKFIKAHYKVDDKADRHIRRALVVLVTGGKLHRTKGIGASGSFKLAEKALKPKAPKPKAVKKPGTPKKKVAAKKPKVSGVTPKSHAQKKPKPTKPKTTKPKKAKTPKKPKALKPKKPVAKKTPKKVAKK
ncbi:unnamed protein product [Calicophoron daubneyi]|uniref:H15 domain-containing protein n=1 Tax=Calicophoron daubneyi TaxID=300641 RepID=A0AAV2TRA6_CALDB